MTYFDGQVLPGDGGCQDCTCSVRGRGITFTLGLQCRCSPHSYYPVVLYPFREVKWCVCSGDAPPCRAHTPLWMAVRAERATDATLMDETVTTENDSPTPQTAVSTAPAWYNPTYLTLCLGKQWHYRQDQLRILKVRFQLRIRATKNKKHTQSLSNNISSIL